MVAELMKDRERVTARGEEEEIDLLYKKKNRSGSILGQKRFSTTFNSTLVNRTNSAMRNMRLFSIPKVILP